MLFLHSHANCFPENVGAISEEQEERFHQDYGETIPRALEHKYAVRQMLVSEKQ